MVERVFGWIVIGLGLGQWVATPVFFKQAEEPAFWFFNGGTTLILVGALNLLRVEYGSVARRVALASVVANLMLAGFWSAMAFTLTYKFTRYPASYVALGIVVLVTVLSLRDVTRR